MPGVAQCVLKIKIFSSMYFEKRSSLIHAGVVLVKAEVVGLAPT
jgi:hypothetical protein